MLAYILRRLIMIPFLLLGVASVSFLLSQMTKGDPLAALVPERMMSNPDIVNAVKAQWGLDQPLPVRYVIYLGNLVQGDLGTSFSTRRPVATDIAERLPATLELVVAAMIIGTVMGLALGLLSARFRGTLFDSVARIFALIGSSLPIFWSGLILLYLFSVRISFVPGTGRLPPRVTAPPDVTGFYTVDALIAGNIPLFLQALSHLALPAFVLGWAVTGVITRLVRSSLIEGLSLDYARTARAKGAPERTVLVKHALPNAMIPLLTILGFTFAYLITGAVLTEAIFSWPGIGSYAVRAAASLDYPAIGGVTIVGSVAFLLANLLTDIAYAWANPRIKVH
ncbi:peptide ABC transporter permease [Primorskyibacter flagellatus]|uniref:Peptide ABC transporter permease n=1 Tax=Primorskyibacter flagellatus TaxID=1387277 RepID=A0A917AGN0_9RHOB|nr:ABC transporter permease [Primorskyibacter flagellatus]GGE51425.1 peptide ABC transporter permease [Primorskyibacter flagellatus]